MDSEYTDYIDGMVILIGKSKRVYSFDLYVWGTEFVTFPAVYIVSERSRKTGMDSVIYIGQTADMGERLTSHHRSNCFIEHNCTHVGIYVEDNELERRRIEKDLIASQKPPCNDIN